jgi:ATP-binding cassette, subfamily B, multidrug efflux pump
MSNLYRLKGYLQPYWKSSVLALLSLSLVVLADLTIPRMIQQIIDEGIAKNNMSVVVNTTLLMLGIAILSVLFAVGNSLLSVRVGESFARDLREALFDKVQTFTFANLDHLKTGQLVVRLTSDVTMVQRIMQMLLRIGTRAPLLMVGSVILLVITSPQLALLMLPLVAVMGLVIFLFAGKMQALFLGVQQKLDRVNTVLQENLSGVRVVKAFVRREYENERFDGANQDLMTQTIKVMELMAFLPPSIMFILNLGSVSVVWFGGLAVIEGSLTVGEILAFINYLLTAMFPLMILVMIVAMLAAGEASAGRLQEVLGDVPDVEDKLGAEALTDVRGKVVFEDVSFSYDGDGGEAVLKGINLTVEAGETVAILGATGSGKSSLVNLIPRFYDVDGGRVSIDGVDVRDALKDSLLAQTGVALQETVLFSGTVRDNIRYGRPDASEAEVREAAKAAQVHEFIEELPDGYDTLIGQRGFNLSGGQKQRIAIARALLVKPKILILDDSTSAVDVDTEGRLQDELEILMKDRTSFIVAQRISSVLTADKIVVLDDGEIAAVGTHAGLLQSSPIYQEIYASQLGDGGF